MSEWSSALRAACRRRWAHYFSEEVYDLVEPLADVEAWWSLGGGGDLWALVDAVGCELSSIDAQRARGEFTIGGHGDPCALEPPVGVTLRLCLENVVGFRPLGFEIEEAAWRLKSGKRSAA